MRIVRDAGAGVGVVTVVVVTVVRPTVAEQSQDWCRALIALGSNLDAPPAQIAAAVAALKQLEGCRLIAVAPNYWSAPWGPPGQPRYMNTAAILETQLSPNGLLRALLKLERQLGKVPPVERFGPRSIDLDLLSYGEVVLDTPELTLPHPRLHERAFVLYPLRDIAPGDWIPGRGRVLDLAAAVDGSETVLSGDRATL